MPICSRSWAASWYATWKHGDIARYQQKRIDAEASPKTVNLEIGTLRAILKRFGQWARLQPNVNMLATRDDIGREITPEEESALLSTPSFIALPLERIARRPICSLPELSDSVGDFLPLPLVNRHFE